MGSRLLLALLIAFNLALAAWWLLGRRGSAPPHASDAGVPVLDLLSDRSVVNAAGAAVVPAASLAPTAASARSVGVVPVAASSTRVVAIATSAPRSISAPAARIAAPPQPTIGETCISYGPLSTAQDLRALRAALRRHAARTRARQEQTTQSRGWWVHLPPSASRPAALAQLRQLAARHLGDAFVMGGGAAPSIVSLGLFRNPANARRRLAEIVAAGFPAQLSARVETVPEYWLDVVAAPGVRLDPAVLLHDEPVGSHSTACF